MNKYLMELSQVEYDLLLSLVNVKLKELHALKSKHIKKLNVIYGANYVEDYIKTLKDVENHFKELGGKNE